MILREFYDRGPDYQPTADLDADRSAPKWRDSRKTKLTLGAINKMRRMWEIRSLENATNLEVVRDQYGQPATPGF